MEEYASYVFQVVCLLIMALIVLSLCLLGCFKSVKTSRSNEPANEATTDVNQVEEASDDREVGGPRGHERALPEIPATLVRVATSVDDEEEEDDSIYDIISKSKKAQPIDNHVNLPGPSSSASAQTKTKSRKKQHPYEKVGGETDGDSSIYGPPSRDPLYTGIKDVKKLILGEADNQGPSSTNQGISLTSAPIPDIFYVSNNAESSNMPRYSASFVPNHSPLLPPRNFQDFTSDLPDHFPNAEPVDCQVQDPRYIPSILDNPWPPNPLPVQTGCSRGNNQENATEETVSDDRRVPNYSSVTARESLNNLRKRGQLLLLHGNQEEMYDTINYDAIKSVSRMHRASTVLSSDHVYCTTGSDLYAEIATGQSSSRSSMYARVSDILPRANSNFSLTNQSHGNNSRINSQMQPSHSSLPRSSAFDHPPPPLSIPSIVRSFYNPEFPIYSVVNKSGRPKTYQDCIDGVESLPIATSSRKSCVESTSSFQNDRSSTPDPSRCDASRTKFKSDHGYSKIIFNKRHQKSSEPTGSKEKYEASIYDCVDDESLYESVPVDYESKFLKFPNQMKVRTNEKIRLPWKDKHKKSNEELRRDNEIKKNKLPNGYRNDSSLLNFMNGGLNDMESKSGSSARNSSVTNCSSFPKFDWGRNSTSFEKNLDSSKNSSTLGKSRFYVTSEMLPEENDVPPMNHRLPSSSPTPPRTTNTLIREHIYELVKDAAYIDDDDDDEEVNMVLESDV